MGQIVRRKKKGRPSKADLARRNVCAVATRNEEPEPERDLRRSLRRRNVKYIFDFDDYIDDEEEFEDERRREKKLKLLLNLQNKEGDADAAAANCSPSRSRRVSHAPDASPSSSDHGGRGRDGKIDCDDEIGGGDDGDDGDDEDNDDGNGIDDDDDEDEDGGGRKAEHVRVDSVPGTPIEPPSGFPLPEKKTLELILDKLQKKDIYGVYAEPVDPDELPDYHDVIKHPMDFSTVRKKLANGIYLTLEQFESDIFLICTNAMQYNAPDTIYHKQARSIQELAKKKFEKLRIDFERTDKEIKPEQKSRSSSLVKKQIKKPISRIVQDPVGSDFSSGATVATAGDIQNGTNAVETSGLERPSSIDGHVEGISTLMDNNVDRTEELQQGKGLMSKLGKKSIVLDENRRATYRNIPNQPAWGESIFTTFEGESKHLVPVGLYADHSYARSLARFSATLGPVAWNVASKRIEQALPPGFKFGRGWVGEYEPLPTPVLMLEKCTLKDPLSLMKFDAGRDDKTCKRRPVLAEPHGYHPPVEGLPPLSGLAPAKSASAFGSSMPLPAKDQATRATLERGPPFLCSSGSKLSVPSTPRNFMESEKKVSKQVELNHPPSLNQRMVPVVPDRHVSHGSELSSSRSAEMVLGNRYVTPSSASKQPNTNAKVNEELPNGKVVSNNSDTNGEGNFSSAGLQNQTTRAAMCFPQGQEQALGDPVQLLKMFAEKAQNQQKSSKTFPVDGVTVPHSVGSPRRDDPNNATAVAARAWMSIGAGGSKPAVENALSTSKNKMSADPTYNPTGGFQPQVSRFRGEIAAPGIYMQQDKSSCQFNGFVSQNNRMANAAQIVQNQNMVFPHLSTAALASFQLQSQWFGRNPQMQLQQQQNESLPPDLNVSFQLQGSPVRQSSGVLVDSQQPDLALQL